MTEETWNNTHVYAFLRNKKESILFTQFAFLPFDSRQSVNKCLKLTTETNEKIEQIENTNILKIDVMMMLFLLMPDDEYGYCYA